MANNRTLATLGFMLLFCSVSQIGQGQEKSPTIESTTPALQSISELTVRGYGGFLMAHRPSMVYLQSMHSGSIEFDYLWRCNGSAPWHAIYRFPSIGLSYRLTGFGNPARIGNGHSISVATEFPLHSGNTFSIRTRGSIGIGWIERPFDVDDNYKNLAAGSHLNGVVGLGFIGGMSLGQRGIIRTGIHFLHYSNGSVSTPNLGLNVPSLSIAYTRVISRKQNVQKTLKEESTNCNRNNNLYLAAGLKEIYPPSGKSYPIAVLDYSKSYPRGKKGVLGGGVAFMYDTSLPEKLRRDKNDEHTDPLNALRIGTYGSAGLRMGPWSASLHVGLYLYNRVKSDGDVFNRLSIRHHRPSGLFYCINLKSHYGKADYFEWGIGTSF